MLITRVYCKIGACLLLFLSIEYVSVIEIGGLRVLKSGDFLTFHFLFSSEFRHHGLFIIYEYTSFYLTNESTQKKDCFILCGRVSCTSISPHQCEVNYQAGCDFTPIP